MNSYGWLVLVTYLMDGIHTTNLFTTAISCILIYLFIDWVLLSSSFFVLLFISGNFHESYIFQTSSSKVFCVLAPLECLMKVLPIALIL